MGRAQLDNDHSLHRDGGFQIRIGGNDRGLHDNEPASPLARGPYRTAIPQASDSQLAHGRADRVLNSLPCFFSAIPDDLSIPRARP
jgi:hypothetical protein